MKVIQLTRGKVAIVDDEDYEELSKYKWYLHCEKRGYAVRHIRKDGKQTLLLMHRSILDATEGEMVDHINHDTLDNRRENLRLATNGQNKQNSRSAVNSSSKYKGVSWYKASKKWVARINRKIYLGTYEDEIEAARAYNAKAEELFGEYAYLNVID